MNELKLIVAGGRDYGDYAALCGHLNGLANGVYASRAISIVSGMARGADALGARFAREHAVVLYESPADWDKYGKRAGFVRNEEMGRNSDALLAFWNGNSKGTASMISFMRSLNKPVHVVRY